MWGDSDASDNIVWGNIDGDNIVWGNAVGDQHRVGPQHRLGQRVDDNIVWGNDCGGADCDNIVWGNTTDDNIVWGNAEASTTSCGATRRLDNIVWGNSTGDEDISWGSSATRRRRLRRRHRRSRDLQPGSLRRSVRGRTARARDAATGGGSREELLVMEKMPFVEPELHTEPDDEYAPIHDNTVTTTDWKASLAGARPARASRCVSCATKTRRRCSRCCRPKKWRDSSRRRRPRSKVSSASSPGRSASARPATTPASRSCRSGMTTAVGIFQVRSLEPGFGTAEWGFAIGSAVLGLGHLRGRRAPDSRLRVRHDRRAPSRGARGGRQRPRQRRAAQGGRGAGGRAAPLVPAATAGITTRCCGASSPKTGACSGCSQTPAVVH